MLTRLKKYAIFIIAIFLLFISRVYANDLQNAFEALTNSTSPGIYNTQVRGFMTGGGYTVSFPQHQVNFISITPPQISAGCGGISIYWGGISYISGAQFTALLKGIAADSLGEAFSIAIRTLCPVCATVLSDLQKAAQAASQLAMNQCSAAMALLDAGIDSVPALRKYIKSRSSLDQQGNGESGSYLQAFSNFTNNLADSIQKRAQDLESITDPTQRQEALNQSPLGNSTWKVLNGLTKQQKIFMMSLMGTTLRIPYPSVDHPTSVKQIPISAALQPSELAHLFMYGADAIINQKLTVLQCDSGHLSKLWQCDHVQTVPIKQSYWYQHEQTQAAGINLTDDGFFGLTYGLLNQAIQNISSQHALGTSASVTLPAALYGEAVVVHPTFNAVEIESFISLAPVPLYRAINLAAFYPTIAKRMISNISELIAAHYAIAYINDFILQLKKTTSESNKAGNQGLPSKALNNVEQSIRSMHSMLKSKQQLLLDNVQAEQTWVNQVNLVQSTIYQQLIRNGLSANVAFSLGLSE